MAADSDFLFDVQGPKARRRTAIITMLVSVVLAVILIEALIQLGQHGHLSPEPWEATFAAPVSLYLAEGLLLSLQAGLVAGLLAFPISALVAIIRLGRNHWLAGFAYWYVEITRALPLLLIIFFFQLYLPSTGLKIPVFWQLVAPLAIYHVSVLSEIIRAGIEAVPRGQSEAARSLGLSMWWTYVSILIPQASRIVLPPLVNQYVRLFKDTSLGFIVSYPELLTRGRTMGEYTGYLFETYVAVGVVYLVVDLALATIARALDRRLRSSRPTRTFRSSAVVEAHL
ncbi:amino acid ABC transporter permease [Rhizobium sp. SYY.PMSO]|uniref:amino acid ABC transporter permease n=1 Tax=Rhizobium sp. SYY.PMSO TaxID=3382192 RepID=UPI00399023EA